MSRRKTVPYGDVKYTQLNDATDGVTRNGYQDLIFQASEKIHIPWRAIGLAVLLFLVGFVMLTAGILLCTGHIDPKYSDRMWPLFTLGTLVFIPGAYHVRIAYLAYRNVPGYSFHDIPEFE